MTEADRSSTILGCLGGALLVLFWIGGLRPEYADALLRPYGLYVWFGILVAAIALPAIAAIRSSKWWFALAAISAFTAIRFFVLVMS